MLRSARRGFLAALLPALALALWTGTARGDEPAGEPGIFDPGPVLRIRIQLSPEAVAELRRTHVNQKPRPYVRGTVHEGGVAYSDVGIKLKGSIGSFRDLSQKPGLTLKFDQYIPGRRFHGLKKVILNNCVQDPSYVQELLGNELFRAAGVPASRTGFAMVELNGRQLGLYVLAEAVTSDFLLRWFKDPTGNLYEGPGDITSQSLDVDSGGAAADREDLKRLVEAAREPDRKTRLESLEKLLDLDRFISFLAVEALTYHWDGYGTGMNNYRIYHDPESGRMVFMPHGTDQLFQNPGAPISPPARGLLASSVLKSAVGRRRHRERLKALTEGPFDVAALQKRIADLKEKLKPYLAELGARALFSHDMAMRSLSVRIAQRAVSVREQLADKTYVPLGPALAFDRDGRARLRGWQPRLMGRGSPQFDREEAGGPAGAALKVTVLDGDDCRASFRKRVFLPPGRYRFTGRIRTEGVEPSPTPHTDGGRSGADLRISGDQPKSKLLGTHGWTRYSFEFDIEPEEEWEGEQPVTQVELVCELEASRGTAWFEEGSLELLKLPPGPPAAAPASAPP